MSSMARAIPRVEVNREVVRCGVEYAANIEFEVDRIDGSFYDDVVAQLPGKALGESAVYDDSLTMVLPVGDLIGPA